jgi:hypothetical protein
VVAKRNYQTTIGIPLEWDSEQRILASTLIIEKIQHNTVKGINRYGNSFPGYSEEYKHSIDFKIAGKSNRVDLQQTGDMLASIELIIHRPGIIVVGYPEGSSEVGKVEGIQIGSYGDSKGHPSMARPFLGLPQEQLDLIIAQVNSQSDKIQSRIDFTAGLISALLSKVNTNG